MPRNGARKSGQWEYSPQQKAVTDYTSDLSGTPKVYVVPLVSTSLNLVRQILKLKVKSFKNVPSAVLHADEKPIYSSSHTCSNNFISKPRSRQWSEVPDLPFQGRNSHNIQTCNSLSSCSGLIFAFAVPWNPSCAFQLPLIPIFIIVPNLVDRKALQWILFICK